MKEGIKMIGFIMILVATFIVTWFFASQKTKKYRHQQLQRFEKKVG